MSETGKIDFFKGLDKILDLMRDLVEVELKSDIGKINLRFGVLVVILFLVFIFATRETQAIFGSFLSVIAFFMICLHIVATHDLKVVNIKKDQFKAKYIQQPDKKNQTNQ